MKPSQTISRAELYRLVWAEPLTRLAERFGVSDVGLRKICQRHDIPLPPQGYRQRAQAGRAQPPAPLPHACGQEMIELPALAVASEFATDLMDRVYGPLLEAESRPDRRIEVPSDVDLKHPIAKRILKALKAAVSTATYRDGVRSVWKDGKTRRVEDCLNEVMAGLYRSSHSAAIKQRKSELRQQRADEENARRELLRAERLGALEQLEELEAQTDAWHRAERLRAFIAAYDVANRGADGHLAPDASAWIDQALRHADRIDPLTPTPVSALDYAEADLRPISVWQIPDD